MRETGPVNLRMSSLRGEGGDYEAEIHYQAIARTILGGLKNRLRLGGIHVGAVRQVLADGTEIIASTILGVGGAADIDSVYINKALPVVGEEQEPIEKEKTVRTITPRLLFGDRTFKRIYSLDLETYAITEEYNATALIAMSSLAAGENSFCIAQLNVSKIHWFTREWEPIKEISLPLQSGAPDFAFNVEYAAGKYYVSLRTGSNAPGSYGLSGHVKVYDESGNELSDTFYGTAWIDWPKTITRNADQPEDETLYGMCSYGINAFDPDNIYTGAAKVDRYDNDLAIAQSIAFDRPYLSGLAVSDDFFFSSHNPQSKSGVDDAETIYKFSTDGKLLASKVLIEAGNGAGDFGFNGRAMVWLNERLVIYGYTLVAFVLTPTIFILDEDLETVKQISLDSGLYSSNGFVAVDLYGGDESYSIEKDDS